MQQHNNNNDLKNLLMHFHDDVNFSHDEMQAIFNYLFENGIFPDQINNLHYQDTLHYLKDLIDLNCFKCIEDIMSYYHSIASDTANELLNTLSETETEPIYKSEYEGTDALINKTTNLYPKHIKSCTNILAQLNAPSHKLNIYQVEWMITPGNFDPFSIQFESDRPKIFEGLSDDIYNCYIHLSFSEFLTNSLDAIKMRREISNQRGIQTSNVGNINIEFKEHDNGDMNITFIDDGIGMDEYMIKNFLSVAGKSYYSIREFQEPGLQMDPIPQFGIGILSCFIVGAEIEIEACKAPYTRFFSEKLKIKIPSVNKQCRIESQKNMTSKVGTSLLVKMLHSKIATREGTQIEARKYLSKIAGFIEFPITFIENDKKPPFFVLILNPI